MPQQIEGSHAIAAAVARCRPEVISCYPITPQTHIVEDLSAMVRRGELGRAEFINAESEFGALSILVGASAAGARAYTATASQGLLFMAEAVYNAGGLGLPIVMTIGNRAIGAPINIWNDHSDSMVMRDAGWIQLYAESNQEAADLHVQAFRLAEQLSCPVMVCVDGFLLTHAYEPVTVPDEQKVNDFLPPYEPSQVLDPENPMTIGAVVGPDAFTEVKYLQHHKHLRALDRIPELSREYREQFGRAAGGLIQEYRSEDADCILVALGSLNGTLRDAVDELRDRGQRVGLVKVCTYQPFPHEALREAVRRARRVLVFEKHLAPGRGGVMAGELRTALNGHSNAVHTVIAGLGGRPIPLDSVVKAVEAARADELEEPHFLDLNREAVDRQIEREKTEAQPGPTTRQLLQRLNAGLAQAP